MISRKDFLKKACISSACMCGFTHLASAANAEETSDVVPEKNLYRNWLTTLLENLDKTDNEDFKRQTVKSCAISHYNDLNMDEVLKPYVGDVEHFIDFLSGKWGWIIEYDRTKQQIIANENKTVCVCPILLPDKDRTNKLICYCSEGFAELMFSKVLNKKVEAEVISSIHWGDKNCIYKISI